MNATPRRYEDSAVRKDGLSSWVCAHCGRICGEHEHAARYCCATEFPCGTPGCDGRKPKGRTSCDVCSARRDDATWEAKVKVDYDGEMVVCEWRGDRFFWNDEEILDYLHDFREEWDDEPADLRLVVCEKRKVRHFEMADFLQDDIHEEDTTDFSAIDKIVNDWIAANANPVWRATNVGINPESLPKLEIEPE